MGKRIEFYEVEEFCKTHSVVLITTREEYIDSKSPIKFICDCGRTSQLSFTKLKISNGFCPGCRYERSASKLQDDYEQVRNVFLIQGCVLITEKYINSNQKLEFICSCGKIGCKRLPDFKDAPYCPDCGMEKGSLLRMESYENVCEYFLKYGCKVITPKNEYKNKRTKVKAICSCGSVFKINVSQFYNGKHQCNDCVINLQSQKKSTPFEEVLKFIEDNNCLLITQKNEYKNSQTILKIKCSCGNIFETRFVLFKHENKRQCNICGIATRSGEFAPRWNGGATSENEKIRKSKAYTTWRTCVYERDNYTCRRCEDNSGGNLNAHHLYNFSEYPELRFDVDNGITLCDSCHNFNKVGSFHHAYGAKNNTPEQLQEYISRYKSGEFNKLVI